MKRITSLILCVLMVVSVFALPVSAVAEANAAQIEIPAEVPKIIINTTETINGDAYVAATIKVIDQQGGEYETIVDEASSVKIRGNSTAAAAKKPYNIKFSAKTDVLGMGKNKKWSILANCFDKTLIRNMTAFEFAKAFGVPYTPDYRVCDVYVNGYLQGSYLIVDSIEVGSTRVDIDTDNNDFLLELDYNPEDEDCQYFYSPTYNIKFAINEPELEDLTADQFTYVQNFMTEAETALASGDYNEVVKYFDVESMMNFYITLEYFKNVDANVSSTRFFIKEGKIYGGPVWDYDLSSGNCEAEYYAAYHNYTGTDIESNRSYEGFHAKNVPWFNALLGYDEFLQSVKERFVEKQDVVVNLYRDNVLGQNLVDYFTETYESTFYRNHNAAGWAVDKVYKTGLQLERDPDPTYEENVAFFRNWLQKRNEWLIEEWELTEMITEAPTDVPKVVITTTEDINKDAYVTSTIKIIDEEGGTYETIVDAASSIKIRGNSTSSADKKPYNIKFSAKTDVLGMGANKKWCLLANCYDKTMLRNITAFEFANALGVPYTPDYRVVDVYVNGSFDGCYLITDAIEVGSTRVDIDTDNNEFLLELDYNPEDEDCQYFYSPTYNIKFAINEPEIEDLTADQFTYVQNFMAEAETALASGDYNEVIKYFDVDSLMNFYLTLEYFKNVDANTSSTRFFIKGDKIYGGPLWDYDLSSGNCNFDYYLEYNNSYTTGNSYEGLWAKKIPWFERLFEYEEFKTATLDRYLEIQDIIVNLYRDNDLGKNRLDTYLEEYGASIYRNHNEAGWTVDKVYNSNLQLERTPDKTYEENLAFYREWLEQRNAWLLNMWGLVEVDIEEPTDVPKIIITTTEEIIKDDYVTATIKIIDEEGGTYETIVDEASSIKIRGNSTSGSAKKPYNIKFSSKTDVLGMGKNKKWCILANSFDKTLLRNVTVFDFANLSGVPYTPDYKVVDVYVNGVFGGCYLITDAIEVGSTRVDIDTDNNEFLLELDYNTPDEDCQYFYSSTYNIKFAINEPEIEDLTEEQLAYVTDLITKAENALASNNYNQIAQYFDIDSMINFYITLEYFKNVDVNTSSTRFHIKGGKIYGGPVWDYDLSSGNCNDDYYYDYNNYTTNDIESNTSYEGLWATSLPWFGRLMNNSTFKNAVYDRYLELQDDIVNLYADNVKGQNRIDYYLDTYAASINRNNNEAGWAVDEVYNPLFQGERDPDPNYEANIKFFRNWLQKRNDWLLSNWGLDSDVTVKSENYSTLNGYKVENVAIGTTAAQLLSDYGNATLMYNGTALTGSDRVCNGAYLVFGNSSTKYSITLKGDVYADGKINAMDYIMVKRAVLGFVTLDEASFEAADIRENGKLDALDFTLIKRHVLGVYTIQ